MPIIEIDIFAMLSYVSNRGHQCVAVLIHKAFLVLQIWWNWCVVIFKSRTEHHGVSFEQAIVLSRPDVSDVVNDGVRAIRAIKAKEIQRMYRGYHCRKTLQSDVDRSLAFYHREVDHLELLLRRGFHVYEDLEEGGAAVSLLQLQGTIDSPILCLSRVISRAQHIRQIGATLLSPMCSLTLLIFFWLCLEDSVLLSASRYHCCQVLNSTRKQASLLLHS
jgi:hypothetical protein